MNTRKFLVYFKYEDNFLCVYRETWFLEFDYLYVHIRM